MLNYFKRIGAAALSACMICTAVPVFAADDAAEETEITAETAADDADTNTFDPDQTIWFDTVPEKADSNVINYLAEKGKVYYGEDQNKSMLISAIDPNNKADNCDYNTSTKDPVESDTVCSRIVSRKLSNNALPIGNGRLGGMVYGAIDKEIVQINEDTFYTLQPSDNDYVLDYDNMSSSSYIGKKGYDTYETDYYNKATDEQKAVLPSPKPATLSEAWENIKNWTLNTIDESDNAKTVTSGVSTRQAMEEYINCYFLGDPYKQAAYQSFVELYLDFGQSSDNVTNYTRSLDLSNAVATVEYDYNDTHYTRENFVSSDKQAVVTSLKADGADKLNVTAELHAWQHSATFEKIADNQIAIRGKGKKSNLQYEARLVVDTDGQLEMTSVTDSPTSSSTSGTTTTYTYYPEGTLNAISVTNATYANCYVVGATSYKNDGGTVTVTKGDTETPKTRCEEYLANLGDTPDYEAIKAAHIADYQSYYNRSSIKLGNSNTDTTQTTYTRFQSFKTSNDTSVVNLYYNFAKYLMISSSREGTQPTNLQGIWNASNMPAWDSKYTININTEMNYWMAQTANLGEFEKPLLETILELEDSGEAVAKAYYGIEDAFVVHHNFDVWRGAAIVDKASTGLWPVGGAWLLNHAWEYYQFNHDAEYLAQFYPLMKKGIKFFDELMVTDPVTGYLISPASVSPEQGGVQPGPTMDHQIIRNLYKITIKANAALKEAGLIDSTDDDLVTQWQDTMSKIAPNEIGSDGYLKEWVRGDVKTDASGSNVSVTHKHTSHLWDVFPGDSVNPYETHDALYNGIKKSVDKRCTSDGTGWSMAWRINLAARLNEASTAYSKLQSLFSTGTYPNGFDRHPPFQIDGNFGGASGIQEMLIQSYADTVNIIPALPSQWSEGEFNKLKARGDFEVSAKWSDGKATDVVVTSGDGGELKLRSDNFTNVTGVVDQDGTAVPYTTESSGTVIVFDTTAGSTYTLEGLTSTATPSPEPTQIPNYNWEIVSLDKENVTFTAPSGTSEEVYVYAAIYDESGEILTDCVSVPVTAAGGTNTVTLDKDMTGAKIYLWDKDYAPLCEAYEK